MANTDKDILITPNRGSSNEPKIEFKGASSTVGPSTITATIYPTNNGTLSFDGTEGSLFSITNNLTTGSIFSVNPISGIPIIDVNADRTIALNPYGGNTGIGLTNPSYKLDVNGTSRFSGQLTIPGNNSILFGPNSTWSRYLRIGGNGWAADSTTASVVTTDGNLHLDAADANHGIYLNWYGGTNGTFFGNGATGQIGRLDGSGNFSVSGTITGTQITSNIANGTAPFVVSSTTKVTNLNADYLDDQTGSYYRQAWQDIDAGVRTNYTLGFQPLANNYAGLYFSKSTSGATASDAGFLLVRGTSDNDIYTAEGITLVADAGWLTLAQRTTASKGVRIMSGTTSSTERLKVTTDGAIEFVNGTGFTYNAHTIWHAGNDGSGSDLDADKLDGEHGSYYLNTSSTTQTKSGNLKITALSESWAEGVSVSLTSSNAWGGYRLRRERGGDDGNWAFGYTALDSTDDLVFISNSGGSQVNNILRLTKTAKVGVNNASPLQALDVRGNFLLAADSTTATHITQKPYTVNGGTLSWEGSSGQLFSITNNLTSGSIFSVNDVSGLPSIDVDANGTIELAPYNGNVGVGTLTPGFKLDVNGTVGIRNVLGVSESGGTGNRLLISTSGSGAVFNQNDNSNIIFQTQGATRFTIAHSTGNITATGNATATNFSDGTGTYNVNLGSGGSEGRGLVAGYSGGSYGGIGYNVRHTTTAATWIAPSADTSSYLLFTAAGFAFYGAAAGAAGRTLSYTTLATLGNTGNLVASGSVSAAGSSGFYSTSFVTNARNPIWRFANSDGYGFSYFQGTSGASPTGGGDTLGFHFGTATAAASLLQLNGGTGIAVNGTTDNISANESGTSSAWRARILSKNSAADKSAFLGVYASSPGVFAHNHALNAWSKLFVNTSDGSSDGGDVTIAGSANVGIGEASPASKLTVRADSAGGRGGEISIVNYAATTVGNEAALNFGLENSTYNADLGNAQIKARVNNANAATDMIFSTWNGSTFGERVRLLSGGNFGISTNSPLQALDVRGNFLLAADATTATHITQKPYTVNGGTLSWEGSEGQLFSIANNLTTGSIFSVNPISGIPIIDVNADRTIALNPYGGNTGIGLTNPSYKLDVNGTSRFSGASIFSSNISLSNGYIRAITNNQPAILSVANGSASTGASFAIQQETAEGWTGIFVDYEPYTGWGLYHDNPNNYFCVTSESSTGNIGSFTVPSRSSGNRTAYEKIRFDQNNGNLIAGGEVQGTIFRDVISTSYYVDPASTSNLWYVQLDDRLSLVKNRGHFTGVDPTTSADGRGQIILNSYYSDVVIASQQTNANHGSTLSFTAVNPSNSGDYRKFVINQGNWTGSHLLRFGWADAAYTNPHSYVTGTFGSGYDVLGLDGVNRITYAFGEMRAPIYRDSNDPTNYYVDPASTSVLNTISITDGNVELYRSQTIDMSNTGTYSVSNYYPVTIQIGTEPVLIQIQNNLNSNAPSWSTHGSGFTLNLRWITNGSGWGTTQVKRKVFQYYEAWTNARICGGISQLTNSSTEVVWLRGGGIYYFKYSRVVTAAAQATNYTVYGQTASVTSSVTNEIWDAATGTENYYANNINATNFYGDGSNLTGITAGATLSASSGSQRVVLTSLTSGAMTSAATSSALTFDSSTGTLSSTIFTSTSDIKKKTNIQNIKNAVELTKQINGVKFDWKETSESSAGVIAQEVEEVLPEIVHTNDEGIKSVNYNGVVGLLVEAIKEQQKQIDELKKELKKLHK